MGRSPLIALAAAVTLGAAGCGEQGIELARDDPHYQGALIFDQRCSGCHTLTVSGSQGSSSDIGSPERKDGPNFNERVEDVEDVLYAIRNGGFSSGPMPQNIVTGEEAEKVADFVAKYSGSGNSGRLSQPTQPGPEGTTPQGPEG